MFFNDPWVWDAESILGKLPNNSKQTPAGSLDRVGTFCKGDGRSARVVSREPLEHIQNDSVGHFPNLHIP